ncbi:MAG: hypothetical protein IIB09_02950, partial [Bacteroidetes bacterium]|nr:hypothetical protein [Bacteroidota bacterium]
MPVQGPAPAALLRAEGRGLAEVEAREPAEAEAVLPEAGAVLPEAEAVLPEAEAVLPEAEAVLPEAEAVLPEAEAVLPEAAEHPSNPAREPLPGPGP